MRFSALVTIGALLGAWGCESGHPPPAGDFPEDDASDDPLFDPIPEAGRPDPDSGALCGSLVVPVAPDHPNFYFVLDGSGSMAVAPDPPIPQTASMYLAARSAIAEVLRAVGHRVNYGAAVFPGDLSTFEEPCPAGTQIFSTRPGDDVSYALAGEEGPVLRSLLRILGTREPQGTTPTSATLRALRPTLEGLAGETFVFLITDGAPNCNEDATCGPEACEENIVGTCPVANCCSSVNAAFAHLGCIDADPTAQAVTDLAALGIRTFVIGLPGTATFSDLLDRLALAGGTGRDRSPYYYPVDRTEQLAELLRQLGAQVAIDCHVDLAEAPPDPARVNVYFDDTLLRQSDEDGWRWASDVRIEIVGQSCDILRSGSVLRVQVAAGCPTVIR